ncbi:MAG: hypothetical protein EAZ27_12445 [Cytophagales bacterium]|nr:MAG: hypothetical protein EAZ27_12445 [Cytophagales bacterium]
MSKSIFIQDIALKAAKVFEENGGQFITPSKVLFNKLQNIHCFIFDWDGVFNDGRKSVETSSNFAEQDAMALHIIRYAYWKKYKKLPLIAIITGADNETAYSFAKREHLSVVFAGYKDKFQALELLRKDYSVNNEAIATIFDDIIDYPLAIESSVRFLVKRSASPLFMNYFKEHKLCDYITYCEQPNYPIREIAELTIGLWGNFDDMLISRFKEKETYAKFWDLRQSVETKIFKFEN